MDKATIADVLEKIATLVELKDENPFKIRAYTNAARSIETWGGNIADLRDQETLEKIPGIGKAIAAKIKELVETGSLKFFDELRAEFPADILELFSLPGLGAKKIKALHEKLQVSSIAQLHEACVAGIVATSAPAAISATFVQHPLVESVIAQGPTKSSVRLRSGIQCDLRVVSTAEYPFALNYFTGSKEHNVVVRSRALQRGWTLNEYR